MAPSRTPPVGSAPFTGQSLDLHSAGYWFMGWDLPAKSNALPITDGRSLKNYTLVRGEAWDFPFDGGKANAIRHCKTAKA